MKSTAATPSALQGHAAFFGCTGLLAFRNGQFAGRMLSRKASLARGTSRIHCVVAIDNPRCRDPELLEDAERRKLKVEKERKMKAIEGLSFSQEQFMAALEKYDSTFSVGDIVKGTVFLIDSNGALVDIGAKALGYMPIEQACSYKIKDLRDMGMLKGMVEEFEVLREDNENSRFILSLKTIHMRLSWERCRQMMAEDVVATGTVVAGNRGGVTMLLESLRAFLPLSQIAIGLDVESLPGKDMPVKMLEVDEEQNRLVVSHRKALVENQAPLGIGSVVVGTVQTVKPYGAFIDIGGLTGLLHVSQISHDRISSVETVLQPGDKLKVMILSQDRDRGRISLSTKKLEPTPGDMLRNPALVFEKADEMAKTFRQRVAQAEAAARSDDMQLKRGGGFGLSADLIAGIDDLLADFPAAEGEDALSRSL